MPYVGKNPTIGNFVKLDAITTSATTTFNLTNGGVAYYPQSPNHCLVSLNGILQAPTDSFTISGSTIIFSSALTTSDVIDFIIVLGDVLNIGTPSDNTVSLAKLTATGTKDSTTFLRGDNTFSVPPAGAMVFLAETSASNVASVALNGYFTSNYDVYKIYIDGVYGSSNAYANITFNTTGSYTEQTSSYSFVMGGYREVNANTEGYVYNSGDSASSISFIQVETSITAGGSAEFVLFNPMSTSHYKLITGNNCFRNSGYIASTGFCGSWDNTTAITGITFKMSTGNIYARKIRIYGIKNS